MFRCIRVHIPTGKMGIPGSMSPLFRLGLVVGILIASSVAPLGAQRNSELAAWYEQAYAYHSAVVSGVEAKPNPSAWQEFLNQMDWASTQLGAGSDWNPVPGGVPGPNGTLVYSAPHAHIAFVGREGVHDIWSNDVTIDIASVSATVHAEITTDTRMSPPMQVIKIVVTDPATGKTSTYYVHDVTTAIEINVPDPRQLTSAVKGVRPGVFRYAKPGAPPGRRTGVRSAQAVPDVARRLEQALARISDADLDLMSAAADEASYEEIAWALGEAERRRRQPRTAFDPVSIGQAIDQATRQSRDRGPEQKVKIHMILLQIMMGDIVGALRSYAATNDRDERVFTRAAVADLNRIRQARERVLAAFARKQPPRAHAGNVPAQSARTQDRAARYTQFVQMSTQLMNELQNTERELVDALQTQFRNLDTFWQAVATFRDQTFRTNDRVMTIR